MIIQNIYQDIPMGSQKDKVQNRIFGSEISKKNIGRSHGGGRG